MQDTNVTLYDGKVSISYGQGFDVFVHKEMFATEEDCEDFLYLQNEINYKNGDLIFYKDGFLYEYFNKYIDNLIENDKMYTSYTNRLINIYINGMSHFHSTGNKLVMNMKRNFYFKIN